MTYPYQHKRKRQPQRDEAGDVFTYNKIWWPLFVALIVPALILAAILLAPVILINLLAG